MKILRVTYISLLSLGALCTVLEYFGIFSPHRHIYQLVLNNHLLITILLLFLMIGALWYVSCLNSKIKEHDKLIDKWRTEYKNHVKNHNKSNQQLPEQTKEWEIIKSKYKLLSVSSGNVVYEPQDSAESKHWICPNCYNKKMKSILQLKKVGSGLFWDVDCPNCEINFQIHCDNLPH